MPLITSLETEHATARAPAAARSRIEQPGARLAYLVGYCAIWLLLPIIAQVEPPSDNFEQLLWADHPALGYPTHPPLPTWVLWFFEQWLPAGLGLTYLLGGVQVGVMLACAWFLGRALLDERRAWFAVLLCTFVTYHTLRMHFYNHNTALLVATAAAYVALVRALRRDRAIDWILLGVCWGLGMLSKYQMVVGIACNVAALALVEPSWRRRWRAVALAGGTAALMFAPHAIWLISNDFPSIHYAAKYVAADLPLAARPERVLGFLSDQLMRLIPMLVLLALLRRWARRSMAPPESIVAVRSRWAPDVASRVLTVHAFGPLIIMAALGLFAGVNLEMHWGTAYLWAITLWLLSRDSIRCVEQVSSERWLKAAIVGQAILAVGYVVDRATWITWPSW
jgi:4-amino-4-deoxy-L-arabinose transferase-like glycosyltransferase